MVFKVGPPKTGHGLDRGSMDLFEKEKGYKWAIKGPKGP